MPIPGILAEGEGFHGVATRLNEIHSKAGSKGEASIQRDR